MIAGGWNNIFLNVFVRPSPRSVLDPEAGLAPDSLAALGGGGGVHGQRGGGAGGGGLTRVLTERQCALFGL